MAGGWYRDGNVQEQIDGSVEDAVKHARRALEATGESRARCEDCDEPIPEGRRQALPGVRRCVACQTEHDAEAAFTSPVNRRASKDSQLR